MNKRFFVDSRAGCIAVRDRLGTDPDYRGLHSTTPGVVWYEHGERASDGWNLKIAAEERAMVTAAIFNAQHEARTHLGYDTPTEAERNA